MQCPVVIYLFKFNHGIKVNNKGINKGNRVVLVSLWLTLNNVTYCSGVFIVGVSHTFMTNCNQLASRKSFLREFQKSLSFLLAIELAVVTFHQLRQ